MDIDLVFADSIIPAIVAGFQDTATYAVDYFSNVVPIGLKIFALVWIVGMAVKWFNGFTGENELDFEVHTFTSDGRIHDIDYDYEISDEW